MQVTKSQVAEILDSKGQELVNNVEALLLAVKSTNDFEAEMARRFGGSVSEDTEHEVRHPLLCCFWVFWQPLFCPADVQSIFKPGLSCSVPCQTNRWIGCTGARPPMCGKQGCISRDGVCCVNVTAQVAKKSPPHRLVQLGKLL